MHNDAQAQECHQYFGSHYDRIGTGTKYFDKIIIYPDDISKAVTTVIYFQLFFINSGVFRITKESRQNNYGIDFKNIPKGNSLQALIDFHCTARLQVSLK